MESFFLPILMIFVAAASGLVGSFALQRRMSLVADAFSHIALPGIGLAFLFNAHPLYGGIIALALGTLLIWALEEHTRLPLENIVGIIFITALAAGALLTPKEEILEVLFGGAETVSIPEFFISVVLAAVVIIIIFFIKDRLTLLAISPEISSSLKIRRGFLNFMYLAVFALTVILGLKFLGILLMGALIIIPAAIAKMFSWNQMSDILLAQGFAIVSVTVGYQLTRYYGEIGLGPIIALTCSLFFAVGCIVKVWIKK